MKGANGIEAMSDQFKIIDYWNRKSMLSVLYKHLSSISLHLLGRRR